MYYSNCRFYYSGVSFRLIDGYFVDFSPFSEENCVVKLVSSDKTLVVEIRIERDCAGAYDELKSVIDGFTPSRIFYQEKISLNGLSGNHAAYCCNRVQRYDIWLDIGDSSTAVNIVISTERKILDVDLLEILATVDPRREGDVANT